MVKPHQAVFDNFKCATLVASNSLYLVQSVMNLIDLIDYYSFANAELFCKRIKEFQHDFIFCEIYQDKPYGMGETNTIRELADALSENAESNQCRAIILAPFGLSYDLDRKLRNSKIKILTSNASSEQLLRVVSE